MDSIIAGRRRFFIKQKREWGEILTGFETSNKYAILDDGGEEIGFAAEEAGGVGGFLARGFLGNARACTLHVTDRNGEIVGTGKKPFRFFFYEMEAWDKDRHIGTIKRRFSILHRVFSVMDASGNEIMRLKSPFLRIWTFRLLVGEEEVGRISKKWSGMMKEMFTDADNFGVEIFDEDTPDDVKKLLLVATFLVDFTCFDQKG